MFKDLISELQEAFGAKEFDTSDTPVAKPVAPKKAPPIPLKALAKNAQKPPAVRLPGVHAKPVKQKDQFAAAKQAIGGAKHKYFESLISKLGKLLKA